MTNIADYESRKAAANLYADECVAILAAQTGVEPSRINREPFINHCFSRLMDGNSPRSPEEQVDYAVAIWRPEHLGIAEAQA